ncbi:type IV secretion system protein VirB10 [Massilia soli]|uniref:Type IV secretion system protein VirB10 n=1 Tax=Massilia soli TaxID=2792854 RepID=A0ABS7SLT2_9BURK|nr:type IV secretion system protein VirB10 [Massilia soli]MBZ2207143.1 type IV secretion system protein VirB10 [Massilia soli]
MTFDRIKRMFAHRALGGRDAPEREAVASADREIPSVNAPRRGSKVTSALALAFIACMGLYLIYQLNTGATRQEKIAKKKEADVARANTIGGALPAIMVPPLPAERPINTPDDADATGVHLVGGMLDAPDRPPPPEDTLQAPATGTTPAAAPPPLTPQQVARLRKQRGALTVELEGDTAIARTAIPEMGAMNLPFTAGAAESGMPLQLASNTATSGQSQSGDELHASLQPTITRATQAAMLPDPSYLITKGASMDCVLETRIDSTVPGMTSCVLSRPMYSSNRKLVLLDAGSKIVGQYAGGLKQGQARIFVLWTRIETPQGIVIQLDSPGTDALGAGGLNGYVDTHFWQRFGGAILLSLIDDALTIAADRSDSASTTINLSTTQAAAQNMATEALKGSINIPPTLRKNHGDQINVFVARDLDFRSVYDIRAQ